MNQHEDAAAFLREHFGAKDAAAYTTEIDGRVVAGTVVANRALFGLYVEPEYRGRGIGRALMRRVTTAHPGLSAMCVPSMVPFYQKFGFWVIGEHAGFAHLCTPERRNGGRPWNKSLVGAWKKGRMAAIRGEPIGACPYRDHRTWRGSITFSRAYIKVWESGHANEDHPQG